MLSLNQGSLLYPEPSWNAQYFWLTYCTFIYPLITTHWSQFSILKVISLRLQCPKVHFMRYNFTVQWTKGSNRNAPDVLLPSKWPPHWGCTSRVWQSMQPWSLHSWNKSFHCCRTLCNIWLAGSYEIRQFMALNTSTYNEWISWSLVLTPWVLLTILEYVRVYLSIDDGFN